MQPETSEALHESCKLSDLWWITDVQLKYTFIRTISGKDVRFAVLLSCIYTTKSSVLESDHRHQSCTSYWTADDVKYSNLVCGAIKNPGFQLWTLNLSTNADFVTSLRSKVTVLGSRKRIFKFDPSYVRPQLTSHEYQRSSAFPRTADFDPVAN